MLNMQGLDLFLVAAKKATYAAADKDREIKEADGSTSLFFTNGGWKYHDNYFGGEPFGGREVVFFENKPIWMMMYYGRVVDRGDSVEPVYGVLRQALSKVSLDKPFRGPEMYVADGLEYHNKVTGTSENFFGEEVITRQGKEIYRASYVGGLVDQL